ncbi:hypothetical protein J6590_026631 [Homalodisca vitripennis]|nr:hypothetical protein J6590_026631 [Homalodisca vitripennis]
MFTFRLLLLSNQQLRFSAAVVFLRPSVCPIPGQAHGAVHLARILRRGSYEFDSVFMGGWVFGNAAHFTKATGRGIRDARCRFQMYIQKDSEIGTATYALSHIMDKSNRTLPEERPADPMPNHRHITR